MISSYLEHMPFCERPLENKKDKLELNLKNSDIDSNENSDKGSGKKLSDDGKVSNEESSNSNEYSLKEKLQADLNTIREKLFELPANDSARYKLMAEYVQKSEELNAVGKINKDEIPYACSSNYMLYGPPKRRISQDNSSTDTLPTLEELPETRSPSPPTPPYEGKGKGKSEEVYSYSLY